VDSGFVAATATRFAGEGGVVRVYSVRIGPIVEASGYQKQVREMTSPGCPGDEGSLSALTKPGGKKSVHPGHSGVLMGKMAGQGAQIAVFVDQLSMV
jgi:hypothetical protein